MIIKPRRKCKVMLADNNWYDGECIAENAAMDYDGNRYHVRLTNEVKIEGKQPVPAGAVYRDCHRDCVKIL